MYTTGNFAKMIGVTIQTLYNWEESGKLVPNEVTKTKRKLYNHEQYKSYMFEKFKIEVK